MASRTITPWRRRARRLAECLQTLCVVPVTFMLDGWFMAMDLRIENGLEAKLQFARARPCHHLSILIVRREGKCWKRCKNINKVDTS